jgi:hypothetical protein
MAIVEAVDGPDAAVTSHTPRRDEVTDQALTLLGAQPRTRPDLAEALGRTRKDGTVRRVVEKLIQEHRIKPDANGVLHVLDGVPGARPLGRLAPGTPPGAPSNDDLAAAVRDGRDVVVGRDGWSEPW